MISTPLTKKEREFRLQELQEDFDCRQRGSNREHLSLINLEWATRYEATIVALENKYEPAPVYETKAEAIARPDTCEHGVLLLCTCYECEPWNDPER